MPGTSGRGTFWMYSCVFSSCSSKKSDCLVWEVQTLEGWTCLFSVVSRACAPRRTGFCFTKGEHVIAEVQPPGCVSLGTKSQKGDHNLNYEFWLWIFSQPLIKLVEVVRIYQVFLYAFVDIFHKMQFYFFKVHSYSILYNLFRNIMFIYSFQWIFTLLVVCARHWTRCHKSLLYAGVCSDILEANKFWPLLYFRG